jgi:hypothetical protein
MKTIENGLQVIAVPTSDRSKRYKFLTIAGLIIDNVVNQAGEIGYNIWIPEQNETYRVWLKDYTINQTREVT